MEDYFDIKVTPAYIYILKSDRVHNGVFTLSLRKGSGSGILYEERNAIKILIIIWITKNNVDEGIFTHGSTSFNAVGCAS